LLLLEKIPIPPYALERGRVDTAGPSHFSWRRAGISFFAAAFTALRVLAASKPSLGFALRFRPVFPVHAGEYRRGRAIVTHRCFYR
jgi:hypothetical protein